MGIEKKIMLIVDDIEMNRAILREYFQKDYEILEASDGEEAYRILQEKFVDILVTDLNMPGLDGFGLIEKIREDSRYDLLKIIAITEVLELGTEEKQRLLELGADDFIAKPFSTELLCHRVKGVMSEEKIKARIEQFEFCMEFSPIPFGIVKLLRGVEGEPRDMLYCYVNHAYGNILNLPATEITGNTHFQLTAENGATWLLLLENVEKNGKADNITIYYDGLQKYFSLNAYQEVEDYCIFFLSDVTEQKQIEKTLRENEQKYRLAMERVPQEGGESALGELRYREEEEYRKQVQPGVLAVSCVNLTANRVEDIYYRDPEQKQEENSYSTEYADRIAVWLQEIHLPQDEAAELGTGALLKAYQEGKQTIKKEFWAVWRRTKDVVWIQVEVRMFCRPETGEIIAFFYNRDVTVERLQSKMIKATVEFDYDYMSYINIRNKHYKMYFGEDNLEETGLDYDAIVRAHVGRVVVTEDAEAVVQAMSLRAILKALEKQDVYTYEYDMQEKDGSIHRKMLRYSYADREMGLIVNTRSDIQQILWVEKEKQDKLERALEDAERASLAKSEFLSRMSHDIRTPMNAIIGMTSIAKSECQEDKIKDYLDQIEGSGKFLLGLINDILDISKIESGKLILNPGVCSLENLISSIQMTVVPLMDEKNIQFQLQQSLDYDHIFVDEVRFKQIFFNLLSNAAKYTPEGGNVSCMVEEIKRRGKKSLVRFQIQDNGIGMSPEFLAHAFEPFMQEQNDSQMQNQGTGLGLAIVKNLVELMKGKIKVESAPGEGTTFIVELPLTIADGEGVQEQEREPGEIERLRGKRVLLVEDNHINTIVARQLLESKGIVVEHAQNGKDAVDLFQLSEAGRYDLILMDIRMPMMNGLEAAETIRGFDRPDAKTVPIIAMTANAYEEDVKKSMAAGMNTHLAKPIDPNLFYQALLTWIK